jgi:hypothetical protein
MIRSLHSQIAPAAQAVFGAFVIRISNLFRVSDFGFRIFPFEDVL